MSWWADAKLMILSCSEKSRKAKGGHGLKIPKFSVLFTHFICNVMLNMYQTQTLIFEVEGFCTWPHQRHVVWLRLIHFFVMHFIHCFGRVLTISPAEVSKKRQTAFKWTLPSTVLKTSPHIPSHKAFRTTSHYLKTFFKLFFQQLRCFPGW